MKVILASKNKGKIKEFQHYFSTTPFDIIVDDCLSDVEETGLSFVENAILKARHACIETGLPAIADDSGLVVDALNGAPGIYSARYAGDDQSNIDKLLRAMKKVPETKRTARFCCVLVFMKHADDPLPVIAQGFWEGRILEAPIGDQGFGYDPVFYVPEESCASAELALDIKNQLSHRAKALETLRAKLLL